MKIVVLGSGTGIPSLKRNAPGYYLKTDHLHALIDCGSASLRQLLTIGITCEQLDAIFITHTHPDHIAELIPLLHALRLPGLKRERPLYIFGPPGFILFFNQFIEPVTGLPTTFSVHIDESKPHWNFSGLSIHTTQTLHSDRFQSVAYRFTENQYSVVFGGDCDLDPGIIKLTHQCDLAILDCSTLENGKVPGHLSAAQCGQIGQKSEVKQILLTHFYPIPEPEEQRLIECQQHFSGSILLAEDFLELFLPSQ
ncbi:MAG: ribonuclease Z [Magnetococcus sp. DMHC-6]